MKNKISPDKERSAERRQKNLATALRSNLRRRKGLDGRSADTGAASALDPPALDVPATATSTLPATPVRDDQAP